MSCILTGHPFQTEALQVSLSAVCCDTRKLENTRIHSCPVAKGLVSSNARARARTSHLVMGTRMLIDDYTCQSSCMSSLAKDLDLLKGHWKQFFSFSYICSVDMYYFEGQFLKIGVFKE